MVRCDSVPTEDLCWLRDPEACRPHGQGRPFTVECWLLTGFARVSKAAASDRVSVVLLGSVQGSGWYPATVRISPLHPSTNDCSSCNPATGIALFIRRQSHPSTISLNLPPDAVRCLRLSPSSAFGSGSSPISHTLLITLKDLPLLRRLCSGFNTGFDGFILVACQLRDARFVVK